MSIEANGCSFVNRSSDDHETVLTVPNLECAVEVDTIDSKGNATHTYTCSYLIDESGRLTSK